MSGSTIINHRQHVGLQKLAALAGITHSYLGPNKKYKFLQDDKSGESALVCSCFRIFESLELTCAVGQLVYETIQAHQRVYHTGSGCLLFLAGAWSRAALECLQRGISVAHIISDMSEGMDVCSDVCRQSSISTDAVGAQQSESGTATSPGLAPRLSKNSTKEVSQASRHLEETMNVAQKRKIKLSRHFCEAKSENVSTVLQPHQPKHPDIAHIAEGLSHGCVSAMNLAVEASRILSNSSQQDVSFFSFDVAKVVTCALPGLPEENACVLPGCIVLLSAEQASVAHCLKDRHLKVALINGDLSDRYRHLGYNRPTGVQRVSDRSDLSSSSKGDAWMEKIMTLLLKLEVNLMLVSGLVSEEAILQCCRHRILAVEKVKASVLKTFADATGAVPVTYATQLSQHCVGTGVTVAIWRDLSSHERRPSTTVNIFTGGKSELVTVLLASCVHGKLQALEDQFWACAYRLHHALKDKALLPGAGVTEMLCVHHLQQQAEQHVEQTKTGSGANPHRGVVLQLMADGLIDYISTVMVNTGRITKVRARTVVSQRLQDLKKRTDIAAQVSQFGLEGDQDDGAVSSHVKSSDAPAAQTYDNLSVKLEGWRKALDLVFLVLQADAEIITGIDQKTEGAQENLMLL